MGTAVVEIEDEGEIVKTDKGKYETVLIQGDLSVLNEEERVQYYCAVCESVGLNPLTKPFEYITLNGASKLYAKRDATDQLRQIHGVSIDILSKTQIGDIYIVEAKATDKKGRYDTSTGAVSIGKLTGSDLANALMKAETKAKRRVTLSICGLGILDESEIEGLVPEQKQNEPKRLELKTIDRFKEKAISFGLPAPLLREFAKKYKIVGDEADEKMEEFLRDENTLKNTIEEFLEENR